MQPSPLIEALSPTRREILRILKERGQATIPELSDRLHLVHESVRKQILDLQSRGWITTACVVEDAQTGSAGRPPMEYCLTPAGDHFFPKDYDGLLLQIMEATKKSHGDEAVIELAAALTDDRVEKLRERVRGPLRQKVDALRAIYNDDDAYIDVESREGGFVLIEKCCPYLNVARKQPLICSTTVSTLRRLLGCEVVRERRFQDGDPRCEFHIKARRPDSSRARFELEPARSGSSR